MCYGLHHFLIVQDVQQRVAAEESGAIGLRAVDCVSSFRDMQVKLITCTMLSLIY